MTESEKTENPLVEREKLLESVISNAPVVLFLIDRQGTIVLSSGRGREGLQNTRPNTVGKSIFDVYRDTPSIIQNYHRALQGESFNVYVEIDGYGFDTRYTPFIDETKAISGVIGVATDVTRHRDAEMARHTSEARFQTIFEVSELGIVLEDLQGRVIESNPAFCEMLGYDMHELRNKNFAEFTHPADLGANLELYEAMVTGRRDSFRLDKRYLCKDGKIVWGRLITSIVVDAEGKPEAVVAMVEDITTKKQMEAELFEVQHRLMHGREQERLHLAQEIHDGPLQDMYTIIFRLKELENVLSSPQQIGLLRQLQNDAQHQVQALRSICGELRPPSLAPFGLTKAIRSHADQFKQLHPELSIELEISPDGQLLPEPTRIALFRIYKELLINVVRHSQATHISVHFKILEHQVYLEVRDNGQGFALPQRWVDMARQNHLGLIGARERAESIGGTLEVWSAPGDGTRVRVTAPRHTGEPIS